jgi:hypothetical protein
MEELALSLFLEGEEDNSFDPTHYRPSSVGSECMRQEALRILHHLEPDNPTWVPPNPHGKKELRGMARLGHAIEREAVEQVRKELKGEARIYTQWGIEAPDKLTNEDGTIVTAHPDMYSRKLKLDIEIKSVSADAIKKLPFKHHRDQHLLRLFWESFKEPMSGLIYYYFRETFYAPGQDAPVRYLIKPHDKGLAVYNSDQDLLELVPRDELEEIHQRLVQLKKNVQNKELPPRSPEDHNFFPCFVRGKHFKAECPWREFCWKEELRREKEPGVMIEAAGNAALQLLEQKEKQKALNADLSVIKKEVDRLQQELDYYFNKLQTNKITAAGCTITRTEVNKKEVVIPPHTYFRYSIRKQQQQ